LVRIADGLSSGTTRKKLLLKKTQDAHSLKTVARQTNTAHPKSGD